MSIASIGIRASKPTDPLPSGVPAGTAPLFLFPPYWPWRVKYLAPIATFGSAGWTSKYTGGWSTGGFEASGITLTTNLEYGVGPDVPFPSTWRPTIVMVISLTCNSVFGANPFRARVRTLSQSVYSANLVPAGTANPYGVAIIDTSSLSGGGIRAFSVDSTGAQQLKAANVIFVGFIGSPPL